MAEFFRLKLSLALETASERAGAAFRRMWASILGRFYNLEAVGSLVWWGNQEDREEAEENRGALTAFSVEVNSNFPHIRFNQQDWSEDGSDESHGEVGEESEEEMEEEEAEHPLAIVPALGEQDRTETDSLATNQVDTGTAPMPTDESRPIKTLQTDSESVFVIKKESNPSGSCHDDSRLLVKSADESNPLVKAADNNNPADMTAEENYPMIIAVDENSSLIVAADENDPLVIAADENNPVVMAVDENNSLPASRSEANEDSPQKTHRDDSREAAMAVDEISLAVASETEETLIALATEDSKPDAASGPDAGVSSGIINSTSRDAANTEWPHCKLCRSRPSEVRLRPCGHASLCRKCFRRVMAAIGVDQGKCPECRRKILGLEELVMEGAA